MQITSILAPLMITSHDDFRKTEHYFGLKNSFSDDYTITKFNYIDEFSIYNGENGKWSLYINISA